MILVTGGTGLVGAHLLFRLTKKNEKVRALYRNEDKRTAVKQVFSFFTDDVDALFQNIEWLYADITDLPSLDEAFKDITQVYHCAALVSFDENNAKEIRKTNIEGTANIVNLCLAYSIKKIGYVSSIATLGEPHNGDLITENTHWNTEIHHSIYAITKYGAEMEVWRAAQEGLPVVIVNPGVILGAGFWNSGSGKIFTRIKNGLNYYTNGVTGFVAVEDVVEAIIRLMESPITERRYILVAENWSYKQLLTTLAEALDVSPPKKAIQPWLLNVLWRIDKLRCMITGKQRFLTKYTAKSMVSISRYSNENIRKDLHVTFTPLSECIRTIADHLK